ncbi:MAG: hypothetical protein ACRYFZ_15000 [Janthinobacterium lividum]
MKQRLLPALALLLLTQCKKAETDPASALPPETQTGANTFGCLLNGQPWTPSSNYGPANFRLTYDPTYAGGSLLIRAYQADAHKVTQYIAIGGSPINRLGTYIITEALSSTCGASYTYQDGSPCSDYSYYNYKPGFIMRGQLTITRMDQIVSGTFGFILAQTGCDTIKVTQGRFDYKL